MARSIRNSAKALIIKDGKMLAVKLKDSEGEWYIMPVHYSVFTQVKLTDQMLKEKLRKKSEML